MADWHPLRGPSPQAQEFVADPENRKDAPLDVSALPALRAEDRQRAESEAPGICETWGVSVRWREVAGRSCLEITPEGGRGTSTLIYLFGGGFISGGPLEDLQIIAPLAARSGMTVLAPDYRLAPENPWPAGLEDAKAVTRAVAAAGPFQMAGESAGGNLALCTVQWLIGEGLPVPSALALMSPAADLSAAFDPLSAPDDPTLNADAINGVPTLYAQDADPSDPAISPLYGVFGPDWPDTIITTGTRDRFVGLCARLERAIRGAGAAADLRVWDGLWHVFEYYPEIPEADLSLTEMSAFLKVRAAA